MAAPPAPAVLLASRLREELSHAGISATVGSGFGVALVTAHRVDVWVEIGPQGWRYRWWTGQTSPEGRREYNSCLGSAVETAARRVATRVRQVRERRLSSATLARTGLRADIASAHHDEGHHS